MNKSDLVLVTGAGGFIGGHLVAELRRRGHQRSVRSISSRQRSGTSCSTDADNLSLDLSRLEACEQVATSSRYVFNLAADMGGMGFIELNRAACTLTVPSTRTC